MVATPNLKQADIDRRARNAFNIGLLITILSSLVVIGTLILQIRTGEDQYIWVTAVGILGGIITMILARRKKPFIGTMVIVSSLFLITFFYVITFEDVSTMLSIIMVVLSLAIAVQTAPAEKVSRSITVIIVFGVGLIILDQFWPSGTRVTPPAYAENIFSVVGGISIILLTVFIIRQFPTFSLRGKLIGATLAVALIAVAVVAVGVNIFTTRAITNQVGANLSTLAESQALAIGGLLSTRINTLEALSSNQIIIQSTQESNANYANSEDSPSKQIAFNARNWSATSTSSPNSDLIENEITKPILEGPIANELKKFQVLFPENSQLVVTDKYGALIGSTRRTTYYYHGSEEWWKDAYVNGFGSVYIGDPAFDWEVNTYSIDMAVPIHGKKEGGGGEIVGILQATVSLDGLENVLQNSKFGETGVIEVFLKSQHELLDDRHLTVNDEGKITFEKYDLDQETLDYIQNPEGSFVITEFDDTSHFLSSSFMNTLTAEPAVDQLAWIILATQHADEILAPVEQQQRINTILGIIVVATAGAVAAYVGTQISKPITNLTNIAQEVAGGNLEIQAPIETQDEIGVLASSFNDMTGQLRDSITTLEQRVQNRTQALATTVEVGRQLSTILDEDELITAVVNQVRDSFDYYQAQIYLLESDGKTLNMASGTGQAGQQMLAERHKLQVGTGLVGQAAENNQVILVSDVTQDESWLPNPLLPDTQSETAVPISIGDKILGVLDVQQDVINGLQQQDADLLQSVANQIAVALRNARLYKETQQRAQNEALLRNINQKISTTTDMRTAMKVAIRELGQATGSSETSIRIKIEQDENGS